MLAISRALVNLYSVPEISDALIFRGGAALNKLFLKPAARYSEDIDLVQKRAEPIGSTNDKIRQSLESWLDEPKRKLTERCAKLTYRYQAISGLPAKLKIEINTTEIFQVLPYQQTEFNFQSDWWSGATKITTYAFDELMASKLKAFYQCREGRDLFDIWYTAKNELIWIACLIVLNVIVRLMAQAFQSRNL